MAAHSKLLCAADVPARPKKLAKTATAEEKAERELLMEERRRLMERMREEQRSHRDRSERARPSKQDEAARRAKQRARIAATVALEAVVAAAMPLTNASERHLDKLLNPALDWEWDWYGEGADNASMKAYRTVSRSGSCLEPVHVEGASELGASVDIASATTLHHLAAPS